MQKSKRLRFQTNLHNQETRIFLKDIASILLSLQGKENRILEDEMFNLGYYLMQMC